MGQLGWQIVLTTGLEDPLRHRLEEHGYMNMENGTRQILEVDSLGVRAKRLPEPDVEPGQSIPRDHWSGHWGGTSRCCMCEGGHEWGEDFFATAHIAYLVCLVAELYFLLFVFPL